MRTGLDTLAETAEGLSQGLQRVRHAICHEAWTRAELVRETARPAL